MNKRIIMLMAAALALLSVRGQVEFSGWTDNKKPIEITLSDSHTTLNKIYVVYDVQGLKMSYTASTGENVAWKRYDANTWREPVAITDITHSGNVTTLNEVYPDMGYVITEGNTPFYCWVVNYADHYLELNDLFYNYEGSCNELTLNVDGQGGPIYYYNIDGERKILDRNIKLSYKTQVWNETDSVWNKQIIDTCFAALVPNIEIEAPFCNTDIKISGDDFLEAWHIGTEAEIINFQTKAVSCRALLEQIIRDNDNEKKMENGWGGSAPVNIIFTGLPTEAVVYREWEMATDPEFEDVILSYNQDVVDYTFYDYGTYYMRYTVANDDGTCPFYSDVFTIVVNESDLQCPNFFSPGSTEGVNDIWKVSYKSIVEFHCWIYNRWGNLVYEFTDPGDGWDGTYRGKPVGTGVYYYVIKATGSDGVKYSPRGAISILNYTGHGDGTNTNVDPGN